MVSIPVSVPYSPETPSQVGQDRPGTMLIGLGLVLLTQRLKVRVPFRCLSHQANQRDQRLSTPLRGLLSPRCLISPTPLDFIGG